MRNLLLALVMLPLFTMAQFISVDGIKYRTLTEFKSIKAYGSDTIVGISVQDTTSPIGAAGYSIITNEDTTLMYLNDDTMNMYTTANNWKFTPKIVADTLIANYIAGLSGEFIPLAGTDSAKPVTGDILYAKNYDNWALEYRDPNETLDKLGVYLDDGNVSLRAVQGAFFQDFSYGGALEGYAIAISNFDSIPTFQGLIGSHYFGANYTNTSYVQKKYVDDNIPTILSNSATLDFPALTPHGHEDLTITVTGAALSDVVSLGIANSSITAEVLFTAYVSATDTVTVRAQNVNGGTPNPASGLFKVKVFK